MMAVVGMLNESLAESLRGFYKLRKAYITLNGILEAESQSLKKRSVTSLASTSSMTRNSMNSEREVPDKSLDESQKSTTRMPPESECHDQKPKAPSESSDDDDDKDQFFDADESFSRTSTPAQCIERVDTSKTITVSDKLADLSLKSEAGEDAGQSSGLKTPDTPAGGAQSDHVAEPDVFSNPIDVFIHSGASVYFGIILLMLAMIPPTFGKLLYVIGFKGDRERGLRLLWQASKYPNINGAMAGLILLGYYNAFVGFCDIMPSSGDDGDVNGYPKARCEDLLKRMRELYPRSNLWRLEQARMEAANRRLSNAIVILAEAPSSTLQQVAALTKFEMGLNSMFSHRYTLCSTSFIECVGLNNWSHTLYYYIAGCAQVELYRSTKTSDPALAREHAVKAVKFLKDAPTHAGKKKFMARQLPFDIFVARKVQKWQSRAEEWGVDFIDAVGVSPIKEMIYFWNGFKRMDSSQLQASLEALAWSESTYEHWEKESLDEKAILAFLRAVTYRNLGKLDDARKILLEEIIAHERHLFKGHMRDDWTCPAAHYEMAVICWMETGEGQVEGKDASEKLGECAEWLDKVAKWESYELDTR
jgi:hypothetical protein